GPGHRAREAAIPGVRGRVVPLLRARPGRLPRGDHRPQVAGGWCRHLGCTSCPRARRRLAIVLRRGPSEWFHVLRRHLDEPRVEPGAWLHGTIYPRRCDVSPDGELLAYFALTSRPPPWDTPVSRAPWLTALAAWHVGSAWTPGMAFADDGALLGPHAGGTPSHGSHPNELRRGWTPIDPRSARLPADAVPALRRERTPATGDALVLVHRGHAFGAPNVEGVQTLYLLESGADVTPLPDAAWAAGMPAAGCWSRRRPARSRSARGRAGGMRCGGTICAASPRIRARPRRGRPTGDGGSSRRKEGVPPVV